MRRSTLKDVLNNKSRQKDPQNLNYYLCRGFPKTMALRKADSVRSVNQSKRDKEND